MIPIYYKSSEGVVVNLIETPYMMLTETELLNSEWQWETIGTNFPKISTLKKSLVSPPFSIRISGQDKSDMMNNLEYLTSVFDRDCFINKMGRIYIGNFYRDCFITKSTKSKVFEKTHTTVQYVATSDDADWKNDKTIIFSGIGDVVGEIADRVIISSSYNNEGIVVEPLANHTAHVKWNGTPYGGNYYWFKLDMGSVMDIDSISGLKLKRPSYTPLSVAVQTSDGETVDDLRNISATVLQETAQIPIDDFTIITVDDFGESSWTSPSLYMYCYVDNEMVDSIKIKSSDADILGQPVDVSNYDYVTFFIAYSSGTTTIDYTVNEEQWTTIETITVPGDSEEEIELSNLTCRYVRLRGAYFGTGFDEDLSVVSGEETSDRNIIAGGYELNNLTRFKAVYSVVDASKKGYILFDAVGVGLKHIYSTSNTGTAKLQGLNNNTWSDIVTITTNMDSVFDNHYDKLRIEVDEGFNSIGLQIMIETDAIVYNESYAPSNAIIKIQGVLNNPSIVIGDNEYGANVELTENNTLEIDTKNKTVRLYNEDGDYTNVFDKRLPDNFEKIESGENQVVWGGSATIIITLDQARSEPKWN